MAPGVDSFAREYMALVRANKVLKKIEVGHLEDWCKSPSLPSDSAIFAESSVTHLTFESVTLSSVDFPFLKAVITHSRSLACLCLFDCNFDNRMSKVVADALSTPGCALKELRVRDESPHVDHQGILVLAESIPKCGLEALDLSLDVPRADEYDEGFEEEARHHWPHVYDVDCATSLAAVLRALRRNTSLRHLHISPVAPECICLRDDINASTEGIRYPGFAERKILDAKKKNDRLCKSVHSGIARELALNADPSKSECTCHSFTYYISYT